jgi:hypothetical protein
MLKITTNGAQPLIHLFFSVIQPFSFPPPKPDPAMPAIFQTAITGAVMFPARLQPTPPARMSASEALSDVKTDGLMAAFRHAVSQINRP